MVTKREFIQAVPTVGAAFAIAGSVVLDRALPERRRPRH